jgi:MarR family transcriptional regulator, transcriptional regulator for hemolysin
MDSALPYDFEESVGYWVTATAQAMCRALNEELAPEGVTLRQWQALAYLARRGAACQSELACDLGVEPPTLARMLQRMERDGWVRREVCASDRRRNTVRLEPRVRPVWRRMAQAARRVRRRATRGLSCDELDVLRRALETVRANLHEEHPR